MAAVTVNQRVWWHSEQWVVMRVWNTNIEGWRVDLRSVDRPASTASVGVSEINLEEVIHRIEEGRAELFEEKAAASHEEWKRKGEE